MKIGIIGLGLIGGSLGIDLRSPSANGVQSQGHYIIGISRQKYTCKLALEKGIADRVDTSFEALSDAEIIIVCTPMGAIASTVKQVIPYINPDTIITDVGSVKYPIVQSCSQLWSNFIGGHPMAGTSSSGIEAAIPSLFTNAAYVFTPSEQNKLEDVEKLKAIALQLNAIPYICDAKIHDRAVSWISHLPVMVSASLIKACLQEKPDTLKLAQILASSGFKDTSRVGGGNPELGVMMAKYNREELLRSLYSYRDNLDGIISLIEEENWQDLSGILTSNGEARPKFLN
ncbi:prephenate/arogenate dehydrogenase [Waterburya agarophytonicola K14]|uniref:Prephenate/arogenate dehydrogenase n=1 Tax=Waterburya agarophytonicola KI4 TaxID=2874699 RepID=A0A964FGF0_9CYAN|nr:prephenate/arogenate dehydrogenase [Waterburya agarophytonicola]MCC0177941.1 prephenate/arogenate dehydrogenase [Waterburya agarophytonicola KI4]